jgi:hypothetical protein
LTKPYYVPVNRILTQIQLLAFVCFDTVILIDLSNGECEKESFHRTRDKRKEFGVGNAEDIVKAHRRQKSKGVDILSKDFRVRFKRNPFLVS